MKYLTFILSLYILALNLAPCEDYAALDNEVKTENLQATNSDHQHQDLDLCSPFCICQCCHINALNFQFADLKLDFPYISIQDFLNLNGTEKEFITSILQPPRA